MSLLLRITTENAYSFRQLEQNRCLRSVLLFIKSFIKMEVQFRLTYYYARESSLCMSEPPRSHIQVATCESAHHRSKESKAFFYRVQG